MITLPTRRAGVLHVVGALALAATMSQAHATGTLFRSYLSANGNDSNPCTLPQPCRLLPAALATTQNAGEVWMLDSANYNTSTVFVSQSVTILAVPGAVGSIVGNGNDALHVTGGTNLKVNLRNIVFRFISGSYTSGVFADPTSSQITVENSQFNGFFHGIFVTGSSSNTLTASNSTFLQNVYAIALTGSGSMFNYGSVDHCTIAGSGAGVSAKLAEVSITNSSVSDSAKAVEVDAYGNIMIGADSFSNDTILASFLNATSSVNSAKDNHTFAVQTLGQGGTINTAYGTL